MIKSLGSKRALLDPIVASAIRVSIACGAHFCLLWLGASVARPTRRPSLPVLAQTALSGLVSVALGMTLLLLALKRGDVGMVSILSSVTPILLLPLLWLRLHRPPAYGAWFGAATSGQCQRAGARTQHSTTVQRQQGSRLNTAGK